MATTLETVASPLHYLDDDAGGWGHSCRICGQRLKEGDGPDLCRRERCNDDPREATPGFAATVTFRGNGPEGR